MDVKLLSIDATEIILKETVLRMKKRQNAGLRRIFKKLRSFKSLKYRGDTALYKGIIRNLRCAGYEVGNRYIVSNAAILDFYNDKDMPSSEKQGILDDLKNSGI